MEIQTNVEIPLIKMELKPCERHEICLGGAVFKPTCFVAVAFVKKDPVCVNGTMKQVDFGPDF